MKREMSIDDFDLLGIVNFAIVENEQGIGIIILRAENGSGLSEIEEIEPDCYKITEDLYDQITAMSNIENN